MKPDTITIIAQVDQSGKLMIANKVEMTDFFRKHQGKKVILKGEVCQPKSSELLVGYYYKKVVPDFQKAIFERDGEWVHLSEIDRMLRSESALMVKEIPTDESNGFEVVELLNVKSVGNAKLTAFVDECRDRCAMNYGWVIEDPNRKA